MRTALIVLVLCLAPSLAGADRVTVKGTVLEGTIQSISDDEVVFETIYGDGDLEIDTSDVSAIESDAPFYVYTTDGRTEAGRVIGVTPTALTLARTDGSQVEVRFDDVDASPREAEVDANWFERSQVKNPFWRRSLDLSLATAQASTDSLTLSTAARFERERGPSRLRFNASYIRSTTRDTTADPPDDEEVVAANALKGFIRQEYDVTDDVFGFGSLDAEHDGVEELAVRLIPVTGIGYKVIDDDDVSLSVDSGVGYVYENFYDDSTNNFLAMGFGFETNVELPWADSEWFARALYLAAVEDWLDSYRLRAETGLLLPLVDQLSFKISVLDEYNSEPAEDTRPNSLTMQAGLSLSY